MDINEVVDIRKELISREDEDLSGKDSSELHNDLLLIVKQKDQLEKSKKEFAGSVNETLKLVKAKQNQITEIFEERDGGI